MKILIIEDEKRTASRLAQIILEFNPDIEICAILSGVSESVNWFLQNSNPDLIFQDIVLNDGDCFEIYERVKVDTPVIFTTAWSEYVLKSFALNSIDYLVKPYDKNDIFRVLEKYVLLKGVFTRQDTGIIREITNSRTIIPRRRILVKSGNQFLSISVENIAYFYYDESVTALITNSGKKHFADSTLTTLSAELDPNVFFRLNRKYLCHVHSITNIVNWFNSRLKVDLSPDPKEEVIVSRDRVKEFKEWLNQ